MGQLTKPSPHQEVETSLVEVRTRSVVFTDVVNSTGIIDRWGDHRWFEVMSSHHGEADRLMSILRGEMLSSTGDGVLAVFTEPEAALCFGVELLRFAKNQLVAVDGLAVGLRCGIATGPVHVWKNNYFGRTMHLAARLTHAAQRSQLYLDGESATALQDQVVALQPQGTLLLRGFAAPQEAFCMTDDTAIWNLSERRAIGE